jgi:AcrR family transcriptional regulator
MRDVARELGLSPGDVFYHFPTKEALIAALVEEAHANNNAVAAPSERLDLHARATRAGRRQLAPLLRPGGPAPDGVRSVNA